MSGTSRRDFLRQAGAAAGATAAASLLPPGLREALAIPAAQVSGTIADVQHIVVLMQENRSFDHYFGAMRGVRGFDDPRAVPLPNGDSVWHQPKTGGGSVLPFHLDTTNTGAQCLGDINHSWKGSQTQWKDHNAWVTTKGPMCMGHFTRADLPFYYALADAFTVCDGYFCSVQGPTNPNRMHLFAATSGLAVNNTGSQAVNNVDDGNWTGDASRDNLSFSAFTWTTYAQRLQAAGISWRVYQEYDNYGDNSLAFFAAFRNLPASSPLYQRARTMVPGSTASNASTSRADFLVAEFARDVQQGTLPQVSWIVAPFQCCEHPDATPAYGEVLTARLLEALAANPQVWAKTVFLINYDENGGFFDHIPPHVPALTTDRGLSTVATTSENYHGVPVGLGIRVPMLAISPWSRGGWVNSQVFDHTSVIRFLEARFGVMEPNIGAWRRAMTGDLTTLFDFATPNAAWPTLPDTSSFMATADTSCSLAQPGVPVNQVMPKQEPGRRPSRPLPYVLDVQGRIEASSGRYWLTLINTGAAGAGFNVLAANRSDGPWYYSVEAGKQLQDYWSAVAATSGIYDLSAYGPNGFLREFRGNLPLATASGGANPEVNANYDAANRTLRLHLSNSGSGSCTLTVVANRYSNEPPRTFVLAPGAAVDDVWNLAASACWYDLSIASDRDADYLRRLAGHMETGQPSSSDPAIGEVVDRVFADAFELV